MRWQDKGRSRNLEDRRGMRSGGGSRRRSTIGATGIIILLIAAALGKTDLLADLGILTSGSGDSSSYDSSASPSAATSPEEEESIRFLSFLIDDMEASWSKKLGTESLAYQAPILVVFRDGVDSACGFSSSATGPFYCPGDQKLYLDLSFFRDLRQRFDAAGDFAQAYVVAHEVGHHLQTLTGISKRMRRLQAQDPGQKNALSVLLELQADCYAGIWAHDASQRHLLEVGDLEEALRAATAIGDDTLQRKSSGQVRPESWTHGSSAQRTHWFRVGYDQGSISACDTFAAAGR